MNIHFHPDVRVGTLLVRMHGGKRRTIVRVESIAVSAYRGGASIVVYDLMRGAQTRVTLKTLRRNYAEISDSEILRAFGERDDEDGDDPYLPLAEDAADRTAGPTSPPSFDGRSSTPSRSRAPSASPTA